MANNSQAFRYRIDSYQPNILKKWYHHSMSTPANHEQSSSDEASRSLLGAELIDWIVNSTDFPLAKAHSINSKSWSDEASTRFNRFNLDAETGGIRSFFEHSRITPEGPLLDIGCTSGHNLAFFHNRRVRPLYGIDISLPFARLAKKRIQEAYIQQADMVALPFRSSYFKTVVARGIFHNTTTQGFLTALREVYRVLRDDGILFLRRRYRPVGFDRLTHFALYTYLDFDDDRARRGAENPSFVRNFIPLPQIKSLIESIGFSLVGEPPIRAIKQINNESKLRYSIECVCRKTSLCPRKPTPV